MNKLKLVTILGTRPEIIRLSETIKFCDTVFENTLVHTGQNWDPNLSDIFFKDLNLRQPDHFLECPGKTLGESLGNIIEKSYNLLSEIKPNALLVLGDTNSALSVISAKRLKIPIFHMEAGNRCYDENVPEEINRRIVDHTSDVNLCYTEHSRKNLLSEGLHPNFTFVTGSPMKEVLSHALPKIDGSEVLQNLNLQESEYFLLSAHREENIDEPQKLQNLLKAIEEISDKFGKKVVVTSHPRLRKKLEEINYSPRDNFIFSEPFGFLDYLSLQKRAFCVLSDSGTLSEESSMLNFPAVLIRTSTERPEVLDEGSIIVGGIEPNGIYQAIISTKERFQHSQHLVRSPDNYKSEFVSNKVASVISSYVQIVNKKYGRT